MHRDGLGTGIETGVDEFLAQPHDRVLDLRRGLPRAVVRTSRARFEPGVAVTFVPGDEFGDPSSGHAVGPGDLCLGAALDEDRSDDQPGTGHLATSVR